MSTWFENGPKASFAGATQIASGNAFAQYLLIGIPAGAGYIDGIKMHINSWGNAFNFNPGQPEGNPELQGLHGFSMAAYDKSTTSEQPGRLLFQTDWINPSITGEYVYRFYPQPTNGTKAFVAFNRIAAFLTMVDNAAHDLLSDFLMGPELTQGGWSTGPTILQQWDRDASARSMSFAPNFDEWAAISWTDTIANSDFGGIESPTNEGLYTATHDFTIAEPSLKKVRGLKQLSPVQKNFAVSKTDEHVYIGALGAGPDVVGRLAPPYTGPEDELFTPTAVQLASNPDLHDENISDSLFITSGINGIDLTDAI